MAPAGMGFQAAASKLAVFQDQRAALTPAAEISQPRTGQGLFQRRRQRPGRAFAPFDDVAAMVMGRSLDRCERAAVAAAQGAGRRPALPNR